MPVVSESEIRRDSSSYVDPHGYLFHLDDGIYRAIHEDSRPFYQRLLEVDLPELTDRHGVVPTECSDLQLAEHPGRMILVHEKIEPLTYCVEWSPTMLRDAGKLTLALAEELAGRNMMLQDAYPYNVLFSGSKPVFVDVTSIVSEDSDVLWPAHEQFEAFFYRPLVLASLGMGQTARMLSLDNIEGLPLDTFYCHTSLGYRWSHPGLWLSRLLSRHLQSSARAKQRLQAWAASTSKYLTREVRLKFYRRLQRRLNAVRLAPVEDPWKNYYAEIPAEVNKERKLATVRGFLQSLNPSTVLDLGCNTGVFSLAAAEQGARVISIDSSESCIETLYHVAATQQLPITPLVTNVLCPTPAFGFLGKQYPPLLQRVRSDVVMCLGLMHHLHLTGRQSFDRIVDLMDEAAKSHLIFEFVAKDDANNELLPQRRKIDYTLESVRDALAVRFARIETFDSDRATRKLLLCSKN